MNRIQSPVFFIAGIFVSVLCLISMCGASPDSSENISHVSACLDFGEKSVKIMASGDQAYEKDEKIHFFGENTVSNTTYLFITGPNLQSSGVRLTNTGTAVTNDDPSSFDVVNAGGISNHYCEWEYDWTPPNDDLEGTYTIYAVSAPFDKQHLNTGKYGSISIIIRGPETPTPTKTTKKTEIPYTIPETTLPVTTEILETVSTDSPTTEIPGTLEHTTPETIPSPSRTKSTVQIPTPLPTVTSTQESPVFPEWVILSLIIALAVYFRPPKN